MRPRPDPEDAARALARLSSAVPPRGGWVPSDPLALPLDDADGTAEHPEPAEPAEPARFGEWDEAPGAKAAGRQAAGGEEASWAPRRDPPVRVGLGRRLAQRLPSTVRDARLDPGRAGAAALVALALVVAAVVALLVLRARPRELPPSQAVPAPAAQGTPTPAASGEVVVSVGGAVARPGLVRLPAGSRVDDAVRAAGGLLPGASFGPLNLARRLGDGEQVLVGVDAPAAAPGSGGGAGAALDLNAATAEQLDALPGVGPVLAERIVAWRAEKGRFGSVDQLREVPGIGESKYAALKAKVRV